MPKKKTTKGVKKSSARSYTHSHTDDHSFLIIAGGGLVILLVVGLFLMGNTPIHRVVAQHVSSQSAVQSEQTVVIKDFAFTPQTLRVKVGTTVTWINSDSVAHSAVSDNGMFDTKLLASGEKGSYTFTKAGTYTYKCNIHPSMTGTIVVEE